MVITSLIQARTTFDFAYIKSKYFCVQTAARLDGSERIINESLVMYICLFLNYFPFSSLYSVFSRYSPKLYYFSKNAYSSYGFSHRMILSSLLLLPIHSTFFFTLFPPQESLGKYTYYFPVHCLSLLVIYLHVSYGCQHP